MPAFPARLSEDGTDIAKAKAVAVTVFPDADLTAGSCVRVCMTVSGNVLPIQHEGTGFFSAARERLLLQASAEAVCIPGVSQRMFAISIACETGICEVIANAARERSERKRFMLFAGNMEYLEKFAYEGFFFFLVF